MKPGCFGSAIYFSVSAPECIACTWRQECAPVSHAAQPAVIGIAAKLDRLFGSDSSARLHAWLVKRWTIARPVKRPSVDVSSVLERWKSEGLNVYHLKHRTNPVASERGLMWEACQFILDAEAFKPRDMVEHLRECDPMRTKSDMQRFVTETCATLVSMDILRKEGTLFCL